MSDNLREEYEKFARSVADQLKKDGRPVETFTADDGTSISGWVFHQRQPGSENGYLSDDGGWREVWGRYLDVLSVDGEVYEYDDYNKDERVSRFTEIRQVRMKTLRKWPISYLVGFEGKPFSKITSQLERLRWTG